MTPGQAALIGVALAHPGVVRESGERMMVPSLLTWLARTGRLRDKTVVAHEVPWLGRRVDLALLTQRGITSAFELKVGSLQRALEQATYNSSSFHRSWIVTPNRPQPHGEAWAKELGIGILCVAPAAPVVVLLPRHRTPTPSVAARVRAAIRSKQVEA